MKTLFTFRNNEFSINFPSYDGLRMVQMSRFDVEDYSGVNSNIGWSKRFGPTHLHEYTHCIPKRNSLSVIIFLICVCTLFHPIDSVEISFSQSSPMRFFYPDVCEAFVDDERQVYGYDLCGNCNNCTYVNNPYEQTSQQPFSMYELLRIDPLTSQTTTELLGANNRWSPNGLMLVSSQWIEEDPTRVFLMNEREKQTSTPVNPESPLRIFYFESTSISGKPRLVYQDFFTHQELTTYADQQAVFDLSDQHLLIGFPFANPAPVFLFVHLQGNVWELSLNIQEPVNLPSPDSEFGYSVTLNEQSKIVCISNPAAHFDSGRVYLFSMLNGGVLIDVLSLPKQLRVAFHQDDSSSNQYRIVEAFQTNQDVRFGECCYFVDEWTLLISSPGLNLDDSQYVGAVHVFHLVGSKWFYTQTLSSHSSESALNETRDSSDSGRRLGWKMDYSNDLLIVSSKYLPKVEVFKRIRSGSNLGNQGNLSTYVASEWEHKWSFGSPWESDSQSIYTQFGSSLQIQPIHTLSNTVTLRVVVSDSVHQTSSSATGSVYTYLYNTESEQWSLAETLTDQQESFRTYFGNCLALHPQGEALIVSVPGYTQGSFNQQQQQGGLYYVWSDYNHCVGCDGELSSCLVDDICGLCGGDNSSCVGCDGVAGSDMKEDYCGTCGGQNDTCIDFTSIEDYYFIHGGSSINHISDPEGFQVELTCSESVLITLVHQPEARELIDLLWVINRADSLRYGTAMIDENVLRYQAYENIQRHSVEIIELELFDYKSSTRVTANVTMRFLACRGCDGVEDSHAVYDQCGVCGGTNDTCTDCNNQINGNHRLDYCQECVLPSQANLTCLTIDVQTEKQPLKCKHSLNIPVLDWNPKYTARYPNEPQPLMWSLSSHHPDAQVSVDFQTGLISYIHQGSTDYTDRIYRTARTQNNIVQRSFVEVLIYDCHVEGCDGIVGSGATVDRCGVCNGDDECVDCMGVPYGTAEQDECGVCMGDGSSCVFYTNNVPIPPSPSPSNEIQNNYYPNPSSRLYNVSVGANADLYHEDDGFDVGLIVAFSLIALAVGIFVCVVALAAIVALFLRGRKRAEKSYEESQMARSTAVRGRTGFSSPPPPGTIVTSTRIGSEYDQPYYTHQRRYYHQ